MSTGLEEQFALRAELNDAAAFKATLDKAAKNLPKLAKDKSLGLSTPKGGDGFYGLASPDGEKVVFGVVGESLVLATDPNRAAQFGAQSPSTVEGANGAFVFATDAGALARSIVAQQGQEQAGNIVAGSLGDLVGSIEAQTDGITGRLKLNVK
jgi:hypothetical protein